MESQGELLCIQLTAWRESAECFELRKTRHLFERLGTVPFCLRIIVLTLCEIYFFYSPQYQSKENSTSTFGSDDMENVRTELSRAK